MPRPIALIPDSADVTNDSADTPLYLAGLVVLEPSENLVIDLTKFDDAGDAVSLQALRSKLWQAIVGAEESGELTINSTTPDVTGSIDTSHPDGIDANSGGVVAGTDVLARRPGLPGYSVPQNGGPQIVSLAVPSGSDYVDITWTEGVYKSDGTSPIDDNDLLLELVTASGLTAVSISSVKQNDNATEGSATALAGGETVTRVFLSHDTGSVDGDETIGLAPAEASVADAEGNLAVELQKTIDLVA